ncbi:Sac2 family-domain-containing protein [Coniochaeta sp. 2T2.1]|nr:Sac2 family-domain-containing protein [Coniochaeta sp. 2T2.1]
MWLDRLAGHGSGGATPQPNSRPISPLPRRTSSSRGPGPYLASQAAGPYVTSQTALSRPGMTPRGSNLSLISNDSNSSFLASSRRPNGSNLKQSMIAEGPDPEEVLVTLLGIKTSGVAPEETPKVTITEDDLDYEFDFGGLSLRDLAQEDTALDGGNVYKPQTVEEYERDKAKFEELHRSIRACDDILNSVETNLTSFRNDLAAVSADIESLQARSSALTVRLENRKAVEKGLAPVVEELSVSPDVVSRISEGTIDEAWVKLLSDLDRRTAAHKKNASQLESKAMNDLGPLLEKLTLKAVERIRDFIVSQIKALRSPNINAQIIQQQNFLRFKDLYTFLHRHHSTLAEEICQAYMNTMRWYYLSQFTRYEKALAKLKLHHLDKTDLLGHEDSSRKPTVISSGSVNKHAGGQPHDAFNLGRRTDLLKTTNQMAISSHLAEEDHSPHYLEVPFRNFNLALVDNASAEYTFLATFFSPALTMGTINRHFNYIFEPTFALGHTLTKTLTVDTYDALGLLLCVRLNSHLAFELQRRRIPAADGYVNGTAMLLWPRLQAVMDGHCESVRAAAAALPSSSSSSKKIGGPGAAPHVVTQRFGQLLQGILSLSAEAGDDEPVVSSLGRLRSEVEAFLTKWSQSTFGSDKRKRERFLYNNYSLVLTIISDVSGKLATEQQAHFERLKAAFQEAA